MSKENICVYGLNEEGDLSALAEYNVVARTHSREELRLALGSLRPRVLIIDLDDADSATVITEALEVAPEICVVGVTGDRDPKAMIAAIRVGCKQLTPKPLDSNDLVIAIRRALNEAPEHQLSGKTVGVISAVGGAGGTTLSCYLAAGLSQTTKASSLVIDLDLDFGGVARAWDLNPSHSIGDLAGAGTVDAVLLKKAAVELPSGVSVLARPRTIEEGHAVEESIIGPLIRTARGVYSQVVIDLPRKLDAVTGAAIEMCDKLLIIVQYTVPAVDNARRLIDVLTRLGTEEHRIEVVANRYRKNTHVVTTEVIEETLKRKVFGIVPNDYKAVSTAIDMGQPMDSRNHVFAAIKGMAAALSGQEVREEPNARWLSMFRRRARAHR